MNRRFMVIVTLTLLCCAGAGLAQPAGKSKLKPAYDLQPQAFFHTTRPWQVKIYPPDRGPHGFNKSNIRVCFVGPGTDCQTIARGLFSSIESAKLEMLAGPQRGTQRPALVIRTTHSAGSSNSAFNDTYVWTFVRDNKPKSGGSFVQLFHYPGFHGEQEFVKSGLLAGAFVSVWQPFTPRAPVRYRIEVYEPSPNAYIQVLSFLSAKRYPSINVGGEPADPVSALMPRIVKAMQAVYPGGAPRLRW